MRLQWIRSASMKLMLIIGFLFPMTTFAHLISIAATSPFPSVVHILSTTTATFTVTNITSHVNLTVIDQSQFPSGSGLSIPSSTCGNLIGPGQSCTITVQLKAPATPQTISSELKEWAKPSADGVRYPFSISIVSPAQYTVTPGTGVNGTISPSVAQVVNSGDNLTFTATPASGYQINQWLLDGSVAQLGGTRYTLSNITSDHTVSATFSTVVPVAVGFSYKTGNTNYMPLAYTSNDGGSNWTLSSLSLPSGLAQGELFGASCASTACAAVGKSFDNSFNNDLPLAFISSDGGNTWTASSTISLPSGQTKGDLNNVFCANSLICTAVGQSFDNSGNNNLPLVYTSNNGGSSWTLSPALSLPSSKNQGFLFGIICEGSICTTVGASDNSGNNIIPLAYISSDSGNHWTLSSTFSLPSGQDEGELFSVICSSSACTAVGETFQTGFTNQLPVAYTSSDGGNHWTLSSSFSLPAGQIEGLLNSVTCSSNNCIAVGETFQVGFSNVFPVVYSSSDGGSTWTREAALPLPGGQTQGFLTHISCAGNACVTGGTSYQAGFANQLPLAYKSSDGGITWTLSSTLPLPSGQNEGEVTGGANGIGH